MTCPDCTHAMAGPWHGFTSSCPSCKARMLSRSPEFVESRRQNKQVNGYRAALRLCGVTHADVLAAAKTDRVRG